MKKLKKITSIILIFAMVAVWLPMSVQAEEIAVESFSFDCHNKTGYIGVTTGGTGILGYSFEPYGSSEAVTMVSSDPTVATVEYVEGPNWWRIYYHKLGTAVITATTASGLTDSCTVTVTEMETVSLDQPFTVTVQPQDNVLFEFVAEDEAYYSFYSEDGNGLLNINQKNPYYGRGVDTQELYGTFIMAAWNDFDTAQTYTLCVKKSVPAEKVVFEQDHYSGDPGDWKLIRASLYPIWSIPEEPVFSSSDEDVVYYDPPGSRYVTLGNPGTATITATTQNGATGQCTVTVYGSEMINLGESKTITLEQGGKRVYDFTPEADGKYVFYMPRGKFVVSGEDEYEENFMLSIYHDEEYVGEKISNSSYEAVSCEMKAGETYQLYARNYWSAGVAITGTVTLDVMEQPKSIRIVNDEETVFEGWGFTLTCEPASGSPFITGNVTWSVSDETVVELIDTWDNSAFYSAVGLGSTVVTATLDNGVSASYEVVVAEYHFYDYTIISGDGAVTIYKNGEPLSVRIDCPIEKFDNHVEVDINDVPPQYYTVTEGSTVITLSAEYLDTLEPGWHGLGVAFTDGQAYIAFEIREQPDVVYGDANGDGKVTTVDLAMLRRYLAAMDPITGVSTITVQAGADVNGDGSIGTVDLAMLRRYLAAMDPITGESTIVLGPR